MDEDAKSSNWPKKSAMLHHYICIKMHFLWILNNKCVIFTSIFLHLQLFHMVLETVIHSINSKPVQYYTYTNSTEKILWIKYVVCRYVRYYIIDRIFTTFFVFYIFLPEGLFHILSHQLKTPYLYNFITFLQAI